MANFSEGFINKNILKTGMPKKAKAAKKPAKKAKKASEESEEEHEKTHGPDVKRLLQEYEQKEDEFSEEQEFVEQHTPEYREEEY